MRTFFCLCISSVIDIDVIQEINLARWPLDGFPLIIINIRIVWEWLCTFGVCLQHVNGPCSVQCLRFSEQPVAPLMNPSAVHRQRLTSLVEAGWPCLLVFTFPQGEPREYKLRSYWLALLLLYFFISCSSRLICSGNWGEQFEELLIFSC